ncbi:MAG: hypothetical protein JNG90_02845, partial [Planctomycetaceae bacterium]|nr:hypothetical protein [Planctomycetaceae bacterium]
MTKPPAPAAAAIPAPSSRLAPWQWWLLAAAVPIYLLASRLTLDLWADEVYTLYDFAAQPIARIISDYSAPNNHILYSLVLHPLALVTQREIWLRLPSLGFALGTLLLVFRLALRTSGVTSAIGATLALGLNVMFLTHALQVRGYGLSMLLLAGLLELAIPGAPGSTRRHRLVLVPLVGAAFLYVLPTNALFLAPVGIAAVLLAWRSAGAADPGLRARRMPWR